MKTEGEYAVDYERRMHRIASAVLYGIWIVVAFRQSGHVFAIRTSIHLFMPVACIWFPHALVTCTGMRWWWHDGAYPGPSHPAFLRWGGWLVLVVVPSLYWFVSR